MCKNQFKKNEKSISLEDLYNKIRQEKAIYEDANNNCSVLLKTAEATDPLTFPSEKDIEQAISAIKTRLESKLGLTSPVHIIFACNNTTKWEASVDINEIIKRNDEFLKEANENAKIVDEKMRDFKIPNK